LALTRDVPLAQRHMPARLRQMLEDRRPIHGRSYRSTDRLSDFLAAREPAIVSTDAARVMANRAGDRAALSASTDSRFRVRRHPIAALPANERCGNMRRLARDGGSAAPGNRVRVQEETRCQ
jgi:hypothetical protein